MQQLILIFHVLACLGIIALVLVQYGKGADVGASFGSGASNTMFGSQGPLSFLVKITAILAIIFFITSLSLSYFAGRATQSNGLDLPVNAPASSVPAPAAPAPAVPAVPSAPMPPSDTH